MTHPIILTTAAEKDLAEALAWYDAIARDLGDRFDVEVRRALAFIEENPLLYARAFREKRCVKLPTFPYWVIYEMHTETVVVMAVFCTSRHPSIWHARQ